MSLSAFLPLLVLTLYALNARGNLGFNPIGTTSTATDPLIVLAAYAFAVWAFIALVVKHF